LRPKLVVDAKSLYFSSDGVVHSIPIGGGATTNYPLNGTYPTAPALDAQNLYYASGIAGDSLISAPLEGGNPFTLLSTSDPTTTVEVNGGYVYFASIEGNSTGVLKRTSASIPDAGMGQVYAADADNTTINPIAFAATGDLYFGNGVGLTDLTIDAGPKAVAMGDVRAIALDSTNVYFTSNGTNGTFAIGRASLGSTNTTNLASGSGSAYGIAVDSTFIYWAVAATQNYGIYRMVK
jgi:hypothetical protein